MKTNNGPLISIIIPVYKVEQYIHKCIKSVINQTYRNLEIILVDDGSPDDCGKICDDYAQNDSRIFVIHKTNGGLSSARNAGIDICKGTYIMFVDSDDYVDCLFCETALNTILDKNVLCVSFGMYEVLGEQCKEVIAPDSSFMDAEEAIMSLICYKGNINNFAVNKIYHHSLFETIRYPIGRLYEDNGTTYKLFHKAAKIYVLNKALYYYVRRDDSITGTPISIRAVNDKFYLWDERLKFLYTNYPNLVPYAHTYMLGLVQSGFLTLPWNNSSHMRNNFKQYLGRYRNDIINNKLNGFLISLYYFCRPIFYVRIFVSRLFHI